MAGTSKDKSAEKVILEVQPRQEKGKENASRLRQEGSVPGVVYGEGKSTLTIQVPYRDLNRVLRTKAGGNVLITLRLKEDAKIESDTAVLIKELQHHPVSHQIIHVDFHRVSLTKRITVAVPLSFKGEAIGVRQEGGLLEHLRWELEVECLPTEIPSEIPVEVGALKLGDTLYAKAVTLPEGVRLVTDPEQPVASCVMPKVEEVAPPVPEEAAAAEPEVIKQKKPEEEVETPEAGKEKAKEPPKKEAPKQEKAKQEQKG